MELERLRRSIDARTATQVASVHQRVNAASSTLDDHSMRIDRIESSLSSATPVNVYTYKEQDGLDAGPITVEFTLAWQGAPSGTGPPNRTKFLIDNKTL